MRLGEIRFLTPGRGQAFGGLWRGALSGALAWTALKILGAWYVARIFLYGAEINAVVG